KIQWDGANNTISTLVESVTVDPSGAFSTTITIPANSAQGNHTVYVVDAPPGPCPGLCLGFFIPTTFNVRMDGTGGTTGGTTGGVTTGGTTGATAPGTSGATTGGSQQKIAQKPVAQRPVVPVAQKPAAPAAPRPGAIAQVPAARVALPNTGTGGVSSADT